MNLLSPSQVTRSSDLIDYFTGAEIIQTGLGCIVLFTHVSMPTVRTILPGRQPVVLKKKDKTQIVKISNYP